MSATVMAGISTPAEVVSVKPLRQCTGKSIVSPNAPCMRRVTWNIEKVGDKCSLHFDIYFDSHPNIPLDSIRRLSDDEKDFSDYKSSGRGGRPRKYPLPAAADQPAG